MYVYQELLRRAEANEAVRVGLVGAGKFGSMFLSQAPSTPGLRVNAIADLDPDRARRACRNVGWSDALVADTAFTDDAVALIRRADIDVVVEATGDPAAGIAHARAAVASGKHVVMVNVEADVLAGPLLAVEAAEADVVYTMAYGDQPALTCEMVEWARCCGFEVIAAGKGTKYLPAYHASTPDTVWDHYGLSAEQAAAAGMNARMFNSFLDGTKSAIEMAAIANATGLQPPPGGGWASRPAGWTTSPTCCARAQTAGSSTTRGRSKWSRRWNATGVPSPGIFAGGSTWSSRPRTPTAPPASGSTE